MRENLTFLCAKKGCNVWVNGIYCYTHRDEYEAERRATSEARSERMKELWKNNRAGMLAAIKAGKAPAVEGK